MFNLQVWSLCSTFLDLITINFLLANADLLKISVFIFFFMKHFFWSPIAQWLKICQVTECSFSFGLKNKDLKSKVRRINLKWILLNQLKWILNKLFRILCRWYQPTQLYFRVGFSSTTQVSFFLICIGNSVGWCHPKAWDLINMVKVVKFQKVRDQFMTQLRNKSKTTKQSN